MSQIALHAQKMIMINVKRAIQDIIKFQIKNVNLAYLLASNSKIKLNAQNV